MSKFIQIHTLTGYSSALINRDDTGLAKRIMFGGKMRTRISSQCRKRAWRMNEGRDAIRNLAGAADDIRSRMVVEKIGEKLVAAGQDPERVQQILPGFVNAVYGDKAWKAPKAKKGEAAPAPDYSARQALLFSGAEKDFIEAKMLEALEAEKPEDAAKAFGKDYKALMKVMREQTVLPSGLTAALFGRMVTSDLAANMDAAIHVAHAFTVHADRSETDFFSAMDDLSPREDGGAGFIGETEISSGLFYGYVSIDVDLLVANLGGDTALAGEVVDSLVRLIATVSPGAKRGGTAPYSYASTALIEAGDALPRNLAEAFRDAIRPETHAAAEEALAAHVARCDEIYGTCETRAWLSFRNEADLPGDRMSLPTLAEFAAKNVVGA